MSDPKVKQVQQWLLNTYSSVPAFADYITSSGLSADGNSTGVTTTALIYALQYELGITEPTGYFGSTTLSLAPTIELDNANSFSVNLIKILEGGLWCHGYSAGYDEPDDANGDTDFGGTFDQDTTNAIIQLETDIGLDATGAMDAYLWMALLSTDAYVTTWSGGSESIREAQQYFNWVYMNGFNFAKEYLHGYIPTDGNNGRAFTTALIYYLQAIIGLSPYDATGELGPYTQSQLIEVPLNLPQDTTLSRHYVRAIVFGLLANGYSLTINSYWSSETQNVVEQFQSDMALPVTGSVDPSTWMALLVSYGDPNRAYTVCDTRFEITASRLATLQSMGIEAVGRYINGTDFKILRDGELARIIDGGLGLIPIYQEDGTAASDFTYAIGQQQAIRALNQLHHFGIPSNSIVYFAVDYDALGYEIESNILPYFQGIKQTLSTYRIGVYGTRNVCSQVISAGYALTAYVSDMSSGFSGNLGFSIPTGWNFDQFNEITMDDWGIDKVGYSGRYGYVTTYVTYTSANLADLPSGVRNDIVNALIPDYLNKFGLTDQNVSFTYQPSSRIVIYADGIFSILWSPSVESALSDGRSYDSLDVTYDGNLSLTTESITTIDEIQTGLNQLFTASSGSMLSGISNILESSQCDSFKVSFIGFDASGFSLSFILQNTTYTTEIQDVEYTVKLSQEFIITFVFNTSFAAELYQSYEAAVAVNQTLGYGLYLILNMANLHGQAVNEYQSSQFQQIAAYIGIGVSVIALCFVIGSLGIPYAVTLGSGMIIDGGRYVIEAIAALVNGYSLPNPIMYPLP